MITVDVVMSSKNCELWQRMKVLINNNILEFRGNLFVNFTFSLPCLLILLQLHVSSVIDRRLWKLLNRKSSSLIPMVQYLHEPWSSVGKVLLFIMYTHISNSLLLLNIASTFIRIRAFGLFYCDVVMAFGKW